ncbi:mitochondrial intermediate peptidase [Suhomyces tanzawaensis NRRL Y-17324]|uniref:Mitochondrial intermediate peptidase n=1 Tax=Suhomyces tanzawaensis NRRL Y-17324 TaxID=984487 RepID=A0A1E4SHA9_9ASCO|nr:mitochondrial intermediate peptidase [Suhomyces tanzawaensis NRRL Y-17324]ODV78894.1 mitochondrial intermediate peptidase [Suhomyces tanzawaensis NRRL Y-17324]
MRLTATLRRSHPFLSRASELRHHKHGVRSAALSTAPEDAHSTHLRRVFDDQKYFQAFNKQATDGASGLFGPRTGLFRNESLSTPHGLVEFSKQSLQEAKALVAAMVADASAGAAGRATYIRKLDQLSDLLCRVIDVAEFIRVAHPSSKWVNAAQQTHEIMFEYMNQLNTNVELYQHLRDILADDSVRAKLTPEEVLVGEYLQQDFERSGIHMDPATRARFVSITQEISLLGSHFNNELHNLQSYWCEVTAAEFAQIPDAQLRSEILSYQGRAGQRGGSGTVQVPLAGHIPYTILTHCPAEAVRKKIWIALHNSSEDQIATLNGFLEQRAHLARMLGYRSFAHYQLEHKMARTPENVKAFLGELQGLLREGGVARELARAASNSGTTSSTTGFTDDASAIRPWDRDYLLARLQHHTKTQAPSAPIADYFSIGTVVAGLSRLFTALYNVKFVPEPTLRGETWDPNQVRKLNVYDVGSNTKLGYLYLDFWLPKVLPSHFTIVCLRRLNEALGTENRSQMSARVQLDGDYQLPVISLVCNFHRANEPIGRFAGIEASRPTLLTLDQVDTVFHEMGHAMHSMLGRTELHNLSGTRCATDFVELPSVLMEQFSKDPRVMVEIGRHHQTGARLSSQLLAQHHRQRMELDECETYMQSKMAMLDQALHSEEWMCREGPPDSTAVYHKLEARLEVFADQWSTWHGKFPHLFSYGAVYYSYLLDRAIAARVWEGLFAADPWSRAAGERYRHSILKWGGTRDPWECLGDALGDPELAGGDSRAMEIIGHGQKDKRG